MSLQDRTLVVRNFDPEKTTPILLKELCMQGGPVRNVVVRPDHAFVEFEDIESVGYCKALLENVLLFDRRLTMEPKTRAHIHFKYPQILQNYIQFDKQQQAMQRQQEQALYQQQMMAYQQQPQNHLPSLQPPPMNPSLTGQPTNFIPANGQQMFVPNQNQQLMNPNQNAAMFASSPALLMHQQPGPQAFSQFYQPPPNLALSNASNTGSRAHNQSFNVPQQQQQPISNSCNLNRSRSFGHQSDVRARRR